MTPIPPDLAPSTEETRSAVYQLVDGVVQVARAEHGTVPGVGTAAWWTAPLSARLAALLVIAEASVLRSPDQIAAERLRALSGDLSDAWSWSDFAAGHVSYAALQRRRAERGPLAGIKFDAEATRRWVETGAS